MGGMLALRFAIDFPHFVRRVLAMATTGRESAQAIAFNEVGRQAIMQDPAWNRGDYAEEGGPRTGLAIARMMAHITYVSDASMDRKFGRRKKDTAAGDAYTFDVQFEVEGYLRHQGQSFINRFDANSYLYITRALDQFDLAQSPRLARSRLRPGRRPRPSSSASPATGSSRPSKTASSPSPSSAPANAPATPNSPPTSATTPSSSSRNVNGQIERVADRTAGNWTEFPNTGTSCELDSSLYSTLEPGRWDC
jgi:homoserine acetyltransferase